MSHHREETGNEGGGKFHTVQASRDLEANWEVDLANKLEDYLLKIFSGEIIANGEECQIRVNFAEAALLLQGSVQVYSRKVEYLYNLVLHTLEFLSQQRKEDQLDGTLAQPKESCPDAVSDEENDLFWSVDDVQVDAKNRLDSSSSKDAYFNNFVKPPANLVVLEGDCLDPTGDGGELESYLLATSDLYRDFILLDPCDAVAVNEFLGNDETATGKTDAYRESSIRKSFQSPTRRSAGTANKSASRKNQDANSNLSSTHNCGFNVNSSSKGPNPHKFDNLEDNEQVFDMDDGSSEPMNMNDSGSDDNDDPWKPLNPHEPGNLRVKPFREVKASRRSGTNSMNRISITTLFPLARMRGTVSPELNGIWEMHRDALHRERKSEDPPLYEKLRQSLVDGECQTFDGFGNPDVENEDNGYDDDMPDFVQPDGDMPENMYMNEDVLHFEKNNDSTAHFDANGAFQDGGPNSQASLEELCRSHLDALLASIAETEKQTELAVLVSSWKQKIEQDLKEQDSRSPFDIHEYCTRILDKLSLEGDSGNITSFADVVKGQQKHDVARSFSALLQLVNNGDVDLDKGGAVNGSVCYAATNPFHIRLLNSGRTKETRQIRLSRKRVKSPIRTKGDREKSTRKPTSPNAKLSPGCRSNLLSSQQPSKFPRKPGKQGGLRCTPESKRRRRSRFVESIDLHSAGYS
ncbi:condensin-2 complex subunit H2 isoform X1 [Carica papaya]|uniref:condensin-2 complex subunit H2 isoform X1 n=2 Tax=Carica papaya TaxID=3649 RepID=UPI000B8D11C9|nr:condensin-2 complex subunit H2 isoform X1 [Carica papaya]